MAKAPLLEIRGLVKTYGNMNGVRNITFTVKEGEIAALLGPNGAGKTTTIRCIVGLLYPEQGDIRIAGHVPGTVEAQRTIAYVPDHPYLYPQLTIEEHLRFRAKAYRVKNASSSIRQALKTFGLEELAGRTAGELSRGQRQRVLLAAAMVQNAQLYVLDEPILGLDPLAQQWLEEWLRRIAEQGCGIVVSTHNLDFVCRIATKVVMVTNGEMVGVEEVHKYETHHALQSKILSVLKGVTTDG